MQLHGRFDESKRVVELDHYSLPVKLGGGKGKERGKRVVELDHYSPLVNLQTDYPTSGGDRMEGRVVGIHFEIVILWIGF